MFRGLPFTYRKSVLADVATRLENRLDHVICSDPNWDFHSVRSDCNLSGGKIAAMSQQSYSSNSATTSVQEDVQLQVHLIRASGVPTEDVSRSSDLLNRGVRFCLCKLPRKSTPVSGALNSTLTSSSPVDVSAAVSTEEVVSANPAVGNTLTTAISGNKVANNKSFPVTPEFIGNVTKLHASLHGTHSDRWEFSNETGADPDKYCFVRCNNRAAGTSTAYDSLDQADTYLFVELVATYQIPGSYDSPAISSDHRAEVGMSQQQLSPPTRNIQKRFSLKNSDFDRSAQSMETMLRVPSDVNSFNPTATVSSLISARKLSVMQQMKSKFFNTTPATGQLISQSFAGGFTETFEPDAHVAGNNNSSAVTDDGTLDPVTRFRRCTTVEMCTGWALIPLTEIMSSNNKKSVTMKVKLQGGTPFMSVSIDERDVKRRAGVYSAMKRMAGLTVASELEIKFSPQMPAVPASSVVNAKPSVSATVSTQDSATHITGTFMIHPLSRCDSHYGGGSDLTAIQSISAFLPPFVVLPSKGAAIVAIYRMILKSATKLAQDPPERVLPQSGHALPVADVVLASFPLYFADPVATRVLMHVWSTEAPVEITNKPVSQLTTADLSEPKVVMAFREVTTRMYRAYNCVGARPNKRGSIVSETFDEMRYREERLKQFIIRCAVATTNTPESSNCDQSSTMSNTQTSVTQPSGSLSRSVINTLVSRVKAKMTQKSNTTSNLYNSLQVSDRDNQGLSAAPAEPMVYLPFNTRELHWQQDSAHKTIFL